MLLLAAVVFITVFALAGLLLLARPMPSKELRATLDSTLKTSVDLREEQLPDVAKTTLFSSIPWIQHALEQMSAVRKLRLILDQADLKWTPARLLLIAGAAFAISSYLLNERTSLGALSLVAALLPAVAPFFYVYRRRRKRFNSMLRKLPDSLDLMVNALRAGHSMVGALGHAAHEAPEPLGRELRLCFEEQNFGIDLRAALQHLVERVPLLELRILTTAMLINKESGGNLAEVLDKTGHVIRDRFRLLQQIRVHTAQGRLTGVILSLMPLVLGSVIFVINPAYIRYLFVNPTGLRMVEVAVGLNVIGMLLIRKIVNIRV
jgi:tight adherence protein B